MSIIVMARMKFNVDEAEMVGNAWSAPRRDDMPCFLRIERKFSSTLV
jgi:hypothetical protein